LLLAGVIRFAIEFLRVNERVLGVLSVADVASIGVMVIGGALLLNNRRRTLQGELRPHE
jgi:prolipoprotein diacylglyceryltransferase